ncbi:MAG TPA: hypothetical protein VGX28_15980 [Frankiaceae bacterium]|jgi:hypothetical protein|nr:hypothetical protein [Frankiaceae bacterium]
MNVRSAAALAVALATIGGTAHAAAPVKKVCNNVKDGTGDTFAARSQDAEAVYGPQEDAFDITSADIASDAKFVTAAIRMVSMGSAQTSPYGKGYAFDFMIPSSEMVITLRAVVPSSGAPVFEASYKDPEVPNSPSTFLGAATGVIDDKKKEVRISAPVSLFAPLGEIKKGTILAPPEDSSASAGRAVPVVPGTVGQPTPTRFTFADVALDAKPYKVGTPSCVTPGK